MELHAYPLRRTFIALLLIVASGCGAEDPSRLTRNSTEPESVHVMKLTSSEFQTGAKLDAKFTVEGQDVSPPLTWADVPAGTRSFALICDDPDAPNPRNPAPEPWVHWIIFNIPADHRELPPGIDRSIKATKKMSLLNTLE